MELIPARDVYGADNRDSKKRFLETDGICTKCGVILNTNHENKCIICEDQKDTCDHSEFITGVQSVDLRILLDFHIEDLKAISELHGCSGGSGRSKTVAGIMKKLHANLDKRIDDLLIRKIIMRNRKKFWFWRDIDNAICKAKKSRGIPLISAEDCIEVKKTTTRGKKVEIGKLISMPSRNDEIKNDGKDS